MRKSLVLLSLFALFATNAFADAGPAVEALDSPQAPFAITSVRADFAGAEKTLTIRTGISTKSAGGALLRVAVITDEGQCRIKGAFRRDLAAAESEWVVTLRNVESSDKVFVSGDVAPTRETFTERKAAYDKLLGDAFQKRDMKPMMGGCLTECRQMQAECSMYCAQFGLGSCTDCRDLRENSCECLICECKESPVNCDYNPCPRW